MNEHVCNKCGGSGTLFNPELTAPSSPCWQCGGTGYTTITIFACISCIEKDKRIAELELQEKELTESRDFWKDKYYDVEAIARQINTEWIPANQKLSARVEAAEAKLQAMANIPNLLRTLVHNDFTDGGKAVRRVANELEALLKEQNE